MWVKGQSGNPKGKPKGTISKLTRSAREAFEYAAQAAGGAEALGKWARANPDKFWPLYIRLAPIEVTHGGVITVNPGEFDGRFDRVFATLPQSAVSVPAEVVN